MGYDALCIGGHFNGQRQKVRAGEKYGQVVNITAWPKLRNPFYAGGPVLATAEKLQQHPYRLEELQYTRHRKIPVFVSIDDPPADVLAAYQAIIQGDPL